MAAIRIDQVPAPVSASERLLEIERYPDRGNTFMPTVAHEAARVVARDVLVTLQVPDAFVAVELTLYLSQGEPSRFLIPDVLLALEVGDADPATGDLREVYRIWDEGRPPDLVIELASKSTVKRDNVGKKEDYAACGVREYVQFDPMGSLLTPRLLVWRLAGDGAYEVVTPGPGGGLPSAVLPGLEWVQVDRLVRLRDGGSGALLPTAAEKEAMGRLRAEEQARQEAARADAEALARRHAKEQAAVAATRADAEATRADAEASARLHAEWQAVAEATLAQTEAARADAADAELARLREEIVRLRGGASPTNEMPPA